MGYNFERTWKKLRKAKKLRDISGAPLIPSWQGIHCPGNGKHPRYECCCDGCDFFIACFPQYDPSLPEKDRAFLAPLLDATF